MADLKTTNIYGDAYINNKVGINTNTPATRLQIGQLSPTAATEGIQFGDDTSTRLYRSSAGTLTLIGGFAGLTLSASTALYGNYGDWSGESNKIQWHSNNLYFVNRGGGSWLFRNSGGSNVVDIASNGTTTVAGNISAANLSGTNTGDQTVGNGTITIAAGTGISVASNTFTTNQTGNSTVTVTNSSPNATHTGDVTGATALTIANDAVTTVKILNANVTNAKLANSSLTIGSTAISLGATATTIAGLTSVTSTTFVGALTGNASTATALTSMNISQFTNNSGYLTSAVTSLAGTTNRITVSGATGAVTLNLPQDIHTGASPTFSGLTVTGITMTNLTGAYQNTTVYDSPKTQSATPSRGIRAPASSIQFTDSYAIAPFWTYRSTGDWPVPYGIGWGTGGESSGIFQRYASNGSSFGDMIFYTGNDGSGAFSFRRHTWEGTTHFAAGSGELNTELFRIDWSGNLTMLGTLNGSANSATFYANNGSYGAWAINGTRNGWGGIEFANNGVSLMMGSDTVGFHQNTNGWLFRVHNGSGFIYKGAWGGGTAATIYDTTNGNGVLLRAAGGPGGYGDWNTFGNVTQTTNVITTEYFNLNGGSGNSNFPPVVSYTYGILANLGSGGDARAQVYISHAGNDLIFRGGWGTSSWQTWNRCLTNVNSPYAYNMDQYVRTTDTVTFSGINATGNLQIRNGDPTITLRDTDHRTAFIHVNSNIFYVLTGATDVAKGNWGIVANSRWPLEINLSNNNATFGGDVNAISFTGAGTGLTGTAASLSIGGNAATATNVTWTGITQSTRTNYDLAFQPPSSGYAGFSFKTSAGGEAGYFLVRGTSDTDVYTAEGITLVADGGWLTLAQRTTASRGVRIMTGTTSSERLKITTAGDIQFVNGNSITYNGNVVLHAGNYNSYSPTLTGTGASGTWDINVTGNAATATTLQTARNINGTSFNGSAAITTATWGTARTITIGSTGKSVDGSANVSWTLAEIGAAATNQTMFIGTTSVAINRASAAITLTGTSIDGNAATATSATSATNSTNASYQSATGTSNDWTQSFQQTPAHATSFREMSAGGPAGTWWMLHNFRHSNNTNYWGTQVAWGWEDNANTMYTRNVLNGAYGSWVKYINSANYTDYTVTKTGTGASGNWAINITGNAATATTATNVTIANGSVTLAKIENITAYTILGNSNASAAATPAALSVATVATMLSGQTMNINGSSTSCSGTAANATTAGGLAVHTGTNNEANKIVRTQGNGYIMAGWINTISGDNGTTAIDRVYASSDGYIRYYTPANFRTVLDVPTRAGSGASGNWAINITGNAATATTATTAGALTTGNTYTIAGLTSNGTINIFPTYADSYSYFLRMGYDNSGNYDYTVKRNGTTGFLEFNGTQTNYVAYYFAVSGASGIGIGVSPAARLHINGDGTNPPIRIDNPALGSGASNSRSFHGWLPISIGGTTKYIQLYN